MDIDDFTRMIIFSHPTGNANARNAIRGLQDADLLASFLTSVATFDGNLYDRLSRLPGFQEFNRRRFDTGLQSKARQNPYRELLRLLSTRAGLSALTRHETGPFCIDAVYRSIDRFTAKRLARQAHAKSGSFTSLKRQNCPPLPSALQHTPMRMAPWKLLAPRNPSDSAPFTTPQLDTGGPPEKSRPRRGNGSRSGHPPCPP